MHTLYLSLFLAFFVVTTQAQQWQLGSHANGITAITSVPGTSTFVTIGNDGVLHAWHERTGVPIASKALSVDPSPIGSYFMPLLYARTDSALLYVVTAQRVTCVQADLGAVAWTLDLEQGSLQDLGMTTVITDTMIYQDQILSTVFIDLRTGVRTTSSVGGLPQPALASCLRVVADSVFRVRYDDGVVLDTFVMPKTIKAFDATPNGTLMAVATDERLYVLAADSLRVIDSIAVPNYFGEKILISPTGGRVVNARGILWNRSTKTKYSFDNDDNAPSSDLLTHIAWSTNESIVSGVAKLPCSNGMACKGGWMTIFNADNGTILAHPIGTVGTSFDASITDDGIYTVLASTGLVSLRRVVDGSVVLNRWPLSTQMLGGATSPTAHYGMYVHFDVDTGGIDPIPMTTLMAPSPSQATITFSVPVTSPVSPLFVTDRMTFTTNATYIVDVLNGMLRVVNVATGAQSDLSVQARAAIRCTGSVVATMAGRSTVSIIDCASLQNVGGFTLTDSVISIAAVRGTSWLVATTATQHVVYDMSTKMAIDTVDLGVDDAGKALRTKHFIEKTGVYVSSHMLAPESHELIATRLRDGVVIRRGDTVHTDVADLCVSPNGFAIVVVASDGRVTTTRGFTGIDTLVVDTTTTAIAGEPVEADAEISVAQGILHVRSIDATPVRVDVVDVVGRILHSAMAEEHALSLAAFPHQALYVRVVGRTRSWTQSIIAP
jgi:WD40 repeat protein